MARHRRGRKGRRGKKGAIPVLPVIGALFPAMAVLQRTPLDANGLKYIPQEMLYEYTGITKEGGFNGQKAVQTLTLIIGTTIAHKVAMKVGVNKYIRKATGGFLVL